MQIKTKTIFICLSFVLILAGCATSVSKFSDDGKIEKLVFPDPQRDAWKKEGTAPNSENLSRVALNQTKDQVYALLGTPHFNEGLGAVREWDYIFNFKEEDGRKEICQYKVIFSKEMRLQQTFWLPEECARYAIVKKPEPIVTEKILERFTERVTYNFMMSSDGFFEFDKSAINDLRPGGKERLDKTLSLVHEKGEIVSVKIIGHTDRLGSDEYNMRLSESRANTIKEYLAMQGVPQEKISAKGVGKEFPIIQCPSEKRSQSLIDCLAPNRRFEIEIETTKKI